MPNKQKDNRICLMHLIQNLGIGGAEILLLHYLKAFGTDEYEHFVYSIGAEGPMKQKIESLGVHLTIGRVRSSIRQPIRFSMDLMMIVKDLLAFIKRHRIQMIQSHLGQANQLGVLIGRLAKIPIFTTVHNTNAFHYTTRESGIRLWLNKTVDKIIYRMAHTVVAVSQEVKDITQASLGLTNTKILVVKNGIILDKDDIKPVDIERETGVHRDTFILVGVGSLTYQKAFEVLIKASALLLENGFSDFIVLIIGEGRERGRLEKLIQNLDLGNHVKLMGLKRNVVGFLKSADIFVMPSRFEGLSIAMIEAMAYGLPIVASDAPGLRTYIKDHQNGLLFLKENHRDLARQILRLINTEDLRLALSQNARNTYCQSFDMHENILPLKDQIRSCMDKPVFSSWD